jgi:aminoglycoside phosphotransferase
MAKTFGQSEALAPPSLASLICFPSTSTQSSAHDRLENSASYLYRLDVVILVDSSECPPQVLTIMTEKSSAACDNAPGNNIVQDLAINNTLINRLFTRIALKTWGKLYKSNGLCSPISKNKIVKTGPRVDLTEAATMKFVADNTSIPVPKVYCSFVHKGRTYILMERIKGEPIGRVLGLEHDVQQKVFEQLKRMMEEMRSLTPPSDTEIQSCTGSSLWDSRIARSSTRFGPFSTIQDFHFWLLEGFRLDDHKDKERTKGEEGKEMADMEAMQDGPWPPPVFTHADLNPTNILVHGQSIAGIIDWKFSGWYPHYWEYTSAWYGGRVWSEWQDALARFLEPHPAELVMEITRQKWWGLI